MSGQVSDRSPGLSTCRPMPGPDTPVTVTAPGRAREQRQPEKFRQLPNSWSCGVVVITSALHADGPRFDPGRDQ